MKHKVAVVGSAGGHLSPYALQVCRELGREIARHDWIIVTGACPGLPHEAVLGARELGALTVGISPALCLDEHINRYGSPWEEYDVLVYTGSGLMGREVEVIRTGDIVIVVGGRSGTLGEFAIAYEDGNVIGVMQGTGGIADNLHHIISYINKPTGTEIVYSTNPAELMDLAIAAYEKRKQEGLAHSINEAEIEWSE